MQDAQIFVSYRRDDTRGWLRQLVGPLQRVFGAGRVFVDTRSIEPGAQFPVELNWALGRVVVVLVLIGPHWADADGRRRLAQPADWVRRELLAALQRDVRIVPVLLGKASLPAAGDLPAELQPLLQRQAAELSEEHWDSELDDLIARLAGSVERDPVCEVTMDLRRVLHLIHLNPETARAVGESAAALRELCRVTARLASRKRVHDLLHEIEEECLQPLVHAPASRHVTAHALKLADAAAAIEAELPASAVPFARAQRLRADLGRAAQALRALDALAAEAGRPGHAADAGEGPASPVCVGEGTAVLEAPVAAVVAAHDKAAQVCWRQAVRGALKALAEVMSSLSRMNDFIADAAGQLRLDDLAAMLVAVRATLDPQAHAHDRERLADNAAKVRTLAAELRWRVAEHGVLQSVDDQLRAAGPAGLRGRTGGGAGEGAGGGGAATDTGGGACNEQRGQGELCERGEPSEPGELRELRHLLDDIDTGDIDPMPSLRQAMQAGHCLHLRRVVTQLREVVGTSASAGPPRRGPAPAAASLSARVPARAWPRRLQALHAQSAHQFNDADVELMALCARLGDLGDSLTHLLDSVGGPR
ncbi:MAG: toll/interleukin-1 receptor domain-containing protein [Rubrivivax sp.]|nr:toll/interleukin-1 receptor domain-containing protein [Rubrivivax sp.]